MAKGILFAPGNGYQQRGREVDQQGSDFWRKVVLVNAGSNVGMFAHDLVLCCWRATFKV
jgi:hypothetical protein